MIKCRFHLVGLFYSTIIGLVWRLSKSAFLCGGFGRRTFYFGQVTLIQKKEKIIYEAKYPRKDYTTDPFFQKALKEAQDDPVKMSSEDIYKAILGNRQYISIPKREEEGNEFICHAIEVSKLYEFNVRITRNECCIQVDLSLDFSGSMKYISRLLGMADEISFDPDNGDRDLCISLIYYTHVVVRNGMSIYP